MDFVNRPFVRRIRATGAISGTALKVLRLLHLHLPALRAIHRPEIEHSKKYYSKKDNVRRIDKICGILEDEKSVDAFLHMIRFQRGYRKEDAPEYADGHYFPDDIVTLTDHEVFVDCGAFTGDTVKTFVKKCNGRYSRIVCLEPDASNAKKLLRRTKKYDKVALVRAGAWKENGVLSFNGGMGYVSKIADAHTEGRLVALEVVAIDEIEACQGVTYLKMDIEGAEMDALLGAEETIRTFSPKLAISIYHSPEDMLDIPEYLHANFPGYRFHVRHHAHDEAAETVLYAIPDGPHTHGG